MWRSKGTHLYFFTPTYFFLRYLVRILKYYFLECDELNFFFVSVDVEKVMILLSLI